MRGAQEIVAERSGDPVLASLSIEPLSSGLTFGGRVKGLRLSDLADPAVVDKLRSLWIERGVLLFTGVEASRSMHLERQMACALS